MFSPKTSAQLTPHLLSVHTTSNILHKIILTQVIIITHIIIKTKVHVLIENTMTTVILFRYVIYADFSLIVSIETCKEVNSTSFNLKQEVFHQERWRKTEEGWYI